MLEVRNLAVKYDLISAIAGLSITAAERTITSIVGSNGAGKTTLLKAISGLIHPAEGEITFLGERIDAASAPDIVRMGISQVPEGRELFPRLSVYDNLMVGAYLRADKKIVRRDLERIYHHFPILKDRQRQMARNLSGGEQQMLAFGRALMSGPKMLLLDEPSIGLAPVVEQKIMETVTALTLEEGVGVVLVEQNAALALNFASYGYVLEQGSLVLEGPASDLVKDDNVRAAYLGL
ncbi:MAG: ABC transporter ATP-binding protein [Rhodospirillales bacterium]|jgi:branched-chain amino acid transport system ATP-binding protein|nr:ABC transporter ATP-binding protein [Rhodospirillales bacterium]MDP6591182.1 ABC transporter ATP-binding protein [Alphaproteobacteria bacterium]MDP6842400.1 ABC transporter ATP-binding protein [Rhodospirillales bacterium]|tara:strand:+ start:4358 stop:5065 length:708 start_codon:yes stop_codon:yes gene_type:complete